MISEDLSFCCPHCGNKYEDEWEFLQSDVLHEIKCDNCAKQFTTLLQECPHCTEESVFVWAGGSPQVKQDVVACRSCGKPFCRDDDGESK